MKKVAINSKNAPEAIGPYSQAIRYGNIVFLSGQIPLDPNTMEIVEGIEAQITLKLKIHRPQLKILLEEMQLQLLPLPEMAL